MKLTFKGVPTETLGHLPAIGSKAPDFSLVKTDLNPVSLKDYLGKDKAVLLNVFVSLDTSICANSVIKFNEAAASQSDCTVLCISKDLPFAHQRFCQVKDIKNVTALSAFRNPDFGDRYGLTIVEGPLTGLLARAVIIINAEGIIKYTEVVPEIAEEPNYEAALKML